MTPTRPVLGGSFLGGAHGRLLPPTIPFRFFLAAALYHLAFWIALAVFAEDAIGFRGGPGPMLGVLHLLTLGVLALAAMGAGYQLLPVATAVPMRARWPMTLSSWLAIPGVAVLVAGMGLAHHETMAAGAILMVLGLGIYAVLLLDNLRRKSSLPAVQWHAIGAMAALLLVIGLGFALVADQHHAIFADHFTWAVAHFLIAAYGFMGLLVLGFSQVLIPMFTLSPMPPAGNATIGLGLAIAGLALAAYGLVGDQTRLVAAGALFGLAASLLHVQTLAASLRQRMRKALGDTFILVFIAWGFLPFSVLLGLGLALGHAVPPALFGWAVLLGWLATFLVAIFQRIVPFLASMHAGRGKRPPLVSTLTPERSRKLHLWCHLVAVAGTGAGLALEASSLVAVAAVIGAVGAAGLLAFTLDIVRRMREGAA
ncbi:MAG: hypothetical protein FJX47_13395 [Alphaproteobacteria bacterium]|nr:hypothetical protein [Alphaproteobacteria bacterium]